MVCRFLCRLSIIYIVAAAAEAFNALAGFWHSGDDVVDSLELANRISFSEDIGARTAVGPSLEVREADGAPHLPQLADVGTRWSRW